MKPLPSLGCRREDLDTPCLILDIEALDRNIARMQSFCRQHQIAWRPHAKSYKSSAVVRRVLDTGAIGITCAKLGEAEVFAALGVSDILITGPIAGSTKLARLQSLRQIADPIVVVDHADHVRMLGEAGFQEAAPLRVLIEIDLGMQRCGVLPGSTAVSLAREIARHPGLAFAGIMGWEGHLLTIEDPAEKRQRIAEAIDGLETTRQALIASGIPCPIVSAGGTGSFPITGTLGVATELEAGGAIFMDLFYRNKCHIEGLEFALTVLTTVISRPDATRAVIDAGRKTLSPDLHLPTVKDRADLNVRWLSAEHGILSVQDSSGPAIGDKLELIPGYGDWTTVLHDHYFVFRGNRLEAIWPLEARSRND